MDDGPFDSLLRLEDQYYQEGYDLGVKDGSRAGLIEGRLFGLEKGFDKYAAMGILHGQAVVWAGRLPVPRPGEANDEGRQKPDHHTTYPLRKTTFESNRSIRQRERETGSVSLPSLPDTTRLEKHIRTFYALVEPSSLSTENNEESVSDFDDRLKRAEGKVKIIEKMIGETKARTSTVGRVANTSSNTARGQAEKGDGSIEDISSLRVRH